MPSEMPHTDVHRAFLQTLSHHGTMSAKQAYKALLGVYAKCKFVLVMFLLVEQLKYIFL